MSSHKQHRPQHRQTSPCAALRRHHLEGPLLSTRVRKVSARTAPSEGRGLGNQLANLVGDRLQKWTWLAKWQKDLSKQQPNLVCMTIWACRWLGATATDKVELAMHLQQCP
eukprot:CAMPEP_0177437814 /NCGR_PEP_ID=MMETSP0369-20130122/2407_1 /TAXON_ID=447022 ORGANISM="Scrippsiella hangoei-like, Strain SHHI-4" /NCGR_SAMPLE_ID=MMETSP0369 /ASSEMBLY_ACC=CAM_ASM_000364 /LENGTH=110 /DNA_ID=CAMNT_0018909309 /DNA_START=127 /DNA_END=459 /DNA_ORIENTATION=-